jgi:superfamily I DNA/RNA helicase
VPAVLNLTCTLALSPSPSKLSTVPKPNFWCLTVLLIDEERRLCYVGMTRAMKKLTMSFAIKRFLHGQSIYAYPSRFLSELHSGALTVTFKIKHSTKAKFLVFNSSTD